MRSHQDYYLIRVNSDGLVRWQYQTMSKSFCEIDIMNFPFDEQTCSIQIRSSARDKDTLKLKRRNLNIKVMESIKTGKFKNIKKLIKDFNVIFNFFPIFPRNQLNFLIK